MKTRLVAHVVSAVLLVCGIAMMTSVVVSLLKGDDLYVVIGLFCSAAITCAVGAKGAWRTPRITKIDLRDGFGIVTFSWIAAAVFGAIPFVLVGNMSIVDALFETMSGFTTTGASVLTQARPDGVFDLPWGLLYWRSLTHWLGGMGIVVLSLAILPLLGIGAMQLYRAEAPGPTSDQLTPRVANTARWLWSIYILLSVAETLMLWPKMGLLEAWCHTCGTMATGGFSTRITSVAAFDSAYVDAVITLFMFLAGCNFLLHYKALSGKVGEYWKDEEWRFYMYLTVACIIIATIFLLFGQVFGSFTKCFRFAAFNIVSILTTTGFGTANFDLWPVFVKVLLVTLMFVGGCGGSTGGGMKCSRVALLLKHAIAQLKRAFYPRSIDNIRLNNRPVPEDVMSRVLGFFVIYLLLFLGIALLLCIIEPGLGGEKDGVAHNEIETAFTASVATLSNIGPGLGRIGPTQNYGWMKPWSKMLLFFSMMLGRLEVFTVIVMLHPRFWRK